jgi:hypothetical protein
LQLPAEVAGTSKKMMGERPSMRTTSNFKPATFAFDPGRRFHDDLFQVVIRQSARTSGFGWKWRCSASWRAMIVIRMASEKAASGGVEGCVSCSRNCLGALCLKTVRIEVDVALTPSAPSSASGLKQRAPFRRRSCCGVLHRHQHQALLPSTRQWASWGGA